MSARTPVHGRGAARRTGSVAGWRPVHSTALRFEDVRARACGHWQSILPALGVPEESLRNRHGPCPGCGGRDRFRFDDLDGRGTWYCGGGGDPQSGDGFALLCHVHGWTATEALHAVARWLGDDRARPRLQAVRTPPRTPTPTWKATIPVPSAFADDYLAMRHPGLGEPASWWRYESATVELHYAVARFEGPTGKAIRPVSYGSAGGAPAWRWKRPHVLIPWNLPELYARQEAPVVVAEGEKAAEAAGRLLPEYVATCGHGGASQAHLTHWDHLSRRTVLIWPDDDAASVEAWAPTLAGILRKLGCTVTVTDPIRGEEAA